MTKSRHRRPRDHDKQARIRADPQRAVVLALTITLVTGCGEVNSVSTAPDQTLPPSPSAPPVSAQPGHTSPSPARVSGLLVAGGSGGLGPDHTDPHSDAVRVGDGGCSGWAPRGRGSWTSGLVAGAGFALIDPTTDSVLGAGELGRGRWVDVRDRQGHHQGQCQFLFTATVSPNSTTPQIQVADLPPWRTVLSPNGSGKLVASVDMPMDGSDIPAACATAATSPPRLSSEIAIHTFWWTGLTTLCKAGFTVTAIQRRCRPPDAASDHVIAVTNSTDPRPANNPNEQSQTTNRPSSAATVTIEIATAIPCSTTGLAASPSAEQPASARTGVRARHGRPWRLNFVQVLSD